MEFNMEMHIDSEIIDEVEHVITADEFAQYLLSHTVNFESAGFILQTLLNAVEEMREKLN